MEPTPEPTPKQKGAGYGQNPPGYEQNPPGFGQKAPGFEKKAAPFVRNPPPFFNTLYTFRAQDSRPLSVIRTDKQQEKA